MRPAWTRAKPSSQESKPMNIMEDAIRILNMDHHTADRWKSTLDRRKVINNAANRELIKARKMEMVFIAAPPLNFLQHSDLALSESTAKLSISIKRERSASRESLSSFRTCLHRRLLHVGKHAHKTMNPLLTNRLIQFHR